MMEIPNINMTMEYVIVPTENGYIVKADGVMTTGRMHLMDLGPLPTRELAESLIKHLESGEGEP